MNKLNTCSKICWQKCCKPHNFELRSPYVRRNLRKIIVLKYKETNRKHSVSSHSNAFTNSTASIVYDFSAASTCVMSSSGNSRRVRLGEPMEGLRMGKRGDRDISCAVRESFGDLRGSIFILLVKGHTKSLQRTKKRVKGEHAALNKTRLQFHASKMSSIFT